jgi:hypothetical protein
VSVFLCVSIVLYYAAYLMGAWSETFAQRAEVIFKAACGTP